jgi:hypothetical protein
VAKAKIAAGLLGELFFVRERRKKKGWVMVKGRVVGGGSVNLLGFFWRKLTRGKSRGIPKKSCFFGLSEKNLQGEHFSPCNAFVRMAIFAERKEAIGLLPAGTGKEDFERELVKQKEGKTMGLAESSADAFFAITLILFNLLLPLLVIAGSQIGAIRR